MGRVVNLTLLAFTLPSLFAVPQTSRPPAKKATVVATAHKASSASRSPGHTGSASLRLASTTTRSAHSSPSALRSRLARGTRAAHATAPSYQLHPDPERYQIIQKALAEKGYFKGEPNGTWGDDSTDAMRRFQADQKIDNDGKIDSLSLISLGLGPKHDGTSAAEPRVAPGPDSVSSPSLIQPSSPTANMVQPR